MLACEAGQGETGCGGRDGTRRDDAEGRSKFRTRIESQNRGELHACWSGLDGAKEDR